MYNSSMADSNHCIVDRRIQVCPVTSVIRQETGHLHRFWSSEANARSTNSLGMLYCASSTRCQRPLSNYWWSLWCYQDYGNRVLIDLPIHLVRRLQSVQNAAARCFNHVTDALVSLHWLRIPEHVVCKIAVVTFKVMHGIAPENLEPVVRDAELPGRQYLRSAGTNRLVVPPFKLSTIGIQAFQVAGPRVCNSLPADITSALSLSTFCQRIKTYFFQKSFPHLTV